MSAAPLLAGPGKIHRFQPAGEGPVYLVRVPTVDEQTEWHRAIRHGKARRVYPVNLIAEVERAVLATMPEGDPDRDRHLATIADYRERLEEAGRLARQSHFDPTLSLDGLARLQEPGAAFEELSAAVSASWPSYDRLLTSGEMWPEVAGKAAARLFLVGWEGEGLPAFVRGPLGGAGDATIMAMPPWHLARLAEEVERLTQWDWRVLGNSPSGSGPSPDPRPSSSEPTPPASGPPPTPGP